MSRLTRDGTAEPVSRDQILRHARGQGNTIFPVQLTTSRIGNLTRLIHTLLYVMTIHTYIHTTTVPFCLWSRRIFPSLPGSTAMQVQHSYTLSSNNDWILVTTNVFTLSAPGKINNYSFMSRLDLNSWIRTINRVKQRGFPHLLENIWKINVDPTTKIWEQRETASNIKYIRCE